METIKKFIFGTIAVFCMLVITACFSHWESGEGTLVFNFRSASAGSRGVFVEGDEYLNFKHVVYLKTAYGRLIEAGEFTGSTGAVSAPIGTYTVYIKGYHETEGVLHSYGISEMTVTISSGRRTDVELDMYSAIEVRDQDGLQNAFNATEAYSDSLLYIFIGNSFDIIEDSDYDSNIYGNVILIAETDVEITFSINYAHNGFINVSGGTLSLGTENMPGTIKIISTVAGEGGLISVSSSRLEMYEGITIQGYEGTAAIRLYSNSEFYMHGGTITGNKRGVFVGGNSNFYMSGGYITKNILEGGSGGGVYVEGSGAIFEMSGGTIEENKANNGGGVYVSGSGATFTMTTGGIITKNNAATSGGGVFINGGTFTMIEDGIGIITKNEASQKGGGVVVTGATGVFNLHSGTISFNRSLGAGGGIHISGGNTYIHDGLITENTSGTGSALTGGSGGGINMEGGTVLMSGGSITENKSNNGGGVNVSDGSFTMEEGGEISGNTARNNGGGVWIGGVTSNRGSFIMTSGEISSNTAENNGGGVWSGGGIVEMRDGKIAGNRAVNGGGIYVGIQGDQTTFHMVDGEISGNIATNDGGGVCVVGVDYLTSFSMVNGEIAGNNANSRGGGVFVGSPGGSWPGTFTMTGGVIYGSNANAALQNTANDGTALYNTGSATINGEPYILAENDTLSVP